MWKDYGVETAKKLLEESLKAPPFTVRVNTEKIGAFALGEELEKEGVTLINTEIDNAFILDKGIDIAKNPLYKNNIKATIQNIKNKKGNVRYGNKQSQ